MPVKPVKQGSTMETAGTPLHKGFRLGIAGIMLQRSLNPKPDHHELACFCASGVYGVSVL